MPHLSAHFSRRLIACVVAVVLLVAACSSSDESTDVNASVDSDAAAPTTQMPTTDPVSPQEVVVRPTGVPEPGQAQPVAPADLGLGTEGASVEETQDLLNDFIGYADTERDRIREDGVFGPNTTSAQQSFERYAGLLDDGVASASDRTALVELVEELESDRAVTTVALGDTSPYVGTWQTRLNTWIALTRDSSQEILVDDTFGDDTETATLDFERSAGLQADGIVEPEDRAALRSAIAEARTVSNVTVVARGNDDDGSWVVRAFSIDGRYCLQFVSGSKSDERCTATLGGDVNTAYFVDVGERLFAAGFANPNVALANIEVDQAEITQTLTRQIGDSLARAWASEIVERPLAVQLLDSQLESVIDMRFVVPTAEQDTFGAILSIEAPSYSESFILGTCTFFEQSSDLVVQGELSSVTMVARATNGTGVISIDGGDSGFIVNGEIETIEANSGDDLGFLLTGTLREPNFAGESFVVSGTCG